MAFNSINGFITYQDLLDSLRSFLQRTTKDSGELEPFWTSLATQANQAAFQDIISGLVGRGYSLDQIALWDRGVEFQTAIGLWWLLEYGLGMDSESYNEVALKKEQLDRRWELKTINFTILGVFQDPKTKYSMTTTGDLNTSKDLFVPVCPNDPRIGQPMRM